MCNIDAARRSAPNMRARKTRSGFGVLARVWQRVRDARSARPNDVSVLARSRAFRTKLVVSVPFVRSGTVHKNAAPDCDEAVTAHPFERQEKTVPRALATYAPEPLDSRVRYTLIFLSRPTPKARPLHFRSV